MPERRPPGRPRDPAVDVAILGAAWTLLAEDGPRRLSPERAAARAGVAVSTVYRRYSSGDALLLALMDQVYATAEAPDTGSLRGDLVALVESVAGVFGQAPQRRALVALWCAIEEDPRLGDAHLAAIEHRRTLFADVLERARERGELGRAVDASLLAETLVSFAILRIVNTQGELPHQAVEDVVTIVLRGVQ